MKRKFYPILLICLLFWSNSLSAQNIPELLYYKFDGSGTTVPNYASAPPVGTTTATIMGAITQGPGTLCSGSLIGSGNASSTDYLNTGWAPNLGASAPWSIVWRASGISTNGTLYYIFGDVNTASFRCFTNGIAGSTNWVIRGAGITDTYINGGALSTPTMCAYVYDPTLNVIRAYLNGVLVSTVAQTTPNLTGTGPFKVMGYSTNVGAPLGGQLDEFRFYNRVLADSEIVELYNPYANADLLPTSSLICPGDTTELDLNPVWPISSVAWSTGSTTDSTWVSDTGYVYVTLSGACATGYDSTYFVSAVTSSSIAPVSCGSYLSPGGDTLSSSGVYQDTIANFNGCDSLITINLTINNNSTNSLNPAICSGDSYLSPGGNSYSSAGTYMDTIPNFNGCDSVITINLTVNNNSSASISPTICSGNVYLSPAGNSYSSAGTYMDTIPSFNGCDSVITINLTVNTVDVTVTQTGASGENLSSNAVGAAYQWVNCPALTSISGETNQAFTATANGFYGVIVTQSGCTDTSACFTVVGLGLNSNGLQNIISLYPNPNKGQFTLDLGMVMDNFTVTVTSSLGEVLLNRLYSNTDKIMLEIEGSSGVYFINVTNNQGERAVLRVIKN